MEKTKIKTRTSSSVELGIIVFGTIAGGIVSVGFGPVAGLLAGIGGIIIGIAGSKSESKEKADKLLPDDKILREARKIHEKTGEKEVGFIVEHKNQNKKIPFLGRLIYGDKEVFEKVVSFKDKD